MTENDVFDRLRSYLLKLDEDAAHITPGWSRLTDIIRSGRQEIQPEGPFAEIQLATVRDSLKPPGEVYEEAVINVEKAIVLERSLVLEWLFRIRLFNTDRVAALRLFNTALKSQFADVALYPLAVTAVSDITIAPWQKAEAWEGQSYIDVTLTGLNTEKMLVDTIDEGRVTIVDDSRGIETEANYQRD